MRLFYRLSLLLRILILISLTRLVPLEAGYYPALLYSNLELGYGVGLESVRGGSKSLCLRDFTTIESPSVLRGEVPEPQLGIYWIESPHDYFRALRNFLAVPGMNPDPFLPYGFDLGPVQAHFESLVLVAKVILPEPRRINQPSIDPNRVMYHRDALGMIQDCGSEIAIEEYLGAFIKVPLALNGNLSWVRQREVKREMKALVEGLNGRSVPLNQLQALHPELYDHLQTGRDFVASQADMRPLRSGRSVFPVSVKAAWAGAFTGSRAGLHDFAPNYGLGIVDYIRDYIEGFPVQEMRPMLFGTTPTLGLAGCEAECKIPNMSVAMDCYFAESATTQVRMALTDTINQFIDEPLGDQTEELEEKYKTLSSKLGHMYAQLEHQEATGQGVHLEDTVESIIATFPRRVGTPEEENQTVGVSVGEVVVGVPEAISAPLPSVERNQPSEGVGGTPWREWIQRVSREPSIRGIGGVFVVAMLTGLGSYSFGPSFLNLGPSLIQGTTLHKNWLEWFLAQWWRNPSSSGVGDIDSAIPQEVVDGLKRGLAFRKDVQGNLALLITPSGFPNVEIIKRVAQDMGVKYLALDGAVFRSLPLEQGRQEEAKLIAFLRSFKNPLFILISNAEQFLSSNQVNQSNQMSEARFESIRDRLLELVSYGNLKIIFSTSSLENLDPRIKSLIPKEMKFDISHF